MASEFTYGSTSWYDFDCIPLKVRVQENYYLAILSNERTRKLRLSEIGAREELRPGGTWRTQATRTCLTMAK